MPSSAVDVLDFCDYHMSRNPDNRETGSNFRVCVPGQVVLLLMLLLSLLFFSSLGTPSGKHWCRPSNNPLGDLGIVVLFLLLLLSMCCVAIVIVIVIVTHHSSSLGELAPPW